MNRKFVLVLMFMTASISIFAAAFDTFDQGDRVRSAIFSPDGNYIAAVGDSGAIKLWAAWGKDNTTPVKIFSGHNGNVNSLAFSADGAMLLSGGDDKMIYMWDVQGANTLPARSFYRINLLKADKVRAVAFVPGGKYIASTGDQKEINLWEISSGTIVKTMTWPEDTKPLCLDVSPTGDRVAAGMDNGTVKVYTLSASDNALVLAGHSGPVSAVRFSPDGKLLAAASYDKTATLWDASTAKIIKTMKWHRAKVNSVAFSHDGRLIATASSDKCAAVWDTAGQGGAPLRTIDGHDAAVNSVSFSLDDRYIATAGDDRAIKLWPALPAEKKQAQAASNTVTAQAQQKTGYMEASYGYASTHKLVVVLCIIIAVLLALLIMGPKQQIPNIIHPKLAEDRDIYLKNRCIGLDIRGFTKADAETQKIWAKQLNSTLDKVLRRFRGYLLILIGDGALVCFLGTNQKPDVHMDFALQFLEEASKYGFKVKMSISEGDDLLKNVVIDGQKSVNCYGNSITRTARLLARGDSSDDEIIIDKIAYDLYFCNAGAYRDAIVKDPATNKAQVNEATRKHEEELELTYVIYKLPTGQA